MRGLLSLVGALQPVPNSHGIEGLRQEIDNPNTPPRQILASRKVRFSLTGMPRDYRDGTFPSLSITDQFQHVWNEVK